MVKGRSDEIISANTFHRDDSPLFQQTHRFFHGFFFFLAAPIALELWTAVMAGDRLSVKTAVFPVGIFTVAEITHGKINHRRILAIIGDLIDNRISRATSHTADEGMTVARIIRIVQIVQTIGTERQIRGDHRRFVIDLAAAGDFKRRERSVFFCLPADMNDLRRFRFLFADRRHESVNSLFGIGHPDIHKAAGVADNAFHSHFITEFGNEGTETDALNDTPDGDFFRCHYSYSPQSRLWFSSHAATSA